MQLNKKNYFVLDHLEEERIVRCLCRLILKVEHMSDLESTEYCNLAHRFIFEGASFTASQYKFLRSLISKRQIQLRLSIIHDGETDKNSQFGDLVVSRRRSVVGTELRSGRYNGSSINDFQSWLTGVPLDEDNNLDLCRLERLEQENKQQGLMVERLVETMEEMAIVSDFVGMAWKKAKTKTRHLRAVK